MKIKYPTIGMCGLSCQLCPAYNMTTKSRCPGCKTEYRLGGPCTILHCGMKKGVEFCGECAGHKDCPKWAKHRAIGKQYDSFKCYQKLEDDITYIQKYGLAEFKKAQSIKEKLLKKLLNSYNEGRSKSYYCIVATVFEVDELEEILQLADKKSPGLEIKEKAKLMHTIIEEIASKKSYNLKLRKKIFD